MQKYGKEIDVHTGDFDKVGVVNHDMGVLKWDYTYFMTKEEFGKLK